MTAVHVDPDRDRGRDLGRPVPQSADPIDRVVRLAPKWTLFVLLACGLLVLGTIIWAVGGTVTTSVSTRGLYNERGTMDVLATRQATVDQVLVSLGQQVTQGQQVVTLEDGSVMVSPQDGTITSVLVSGGSVLSPNEATMEVTDLATVDQVVTVVPASMTGSVVVGMPARIAVSSAPPSRYGYLLGTIDAISRSPDTVAQIATKLELEEGVVASLLGAEPALLATIRLNFDPNVPSGYRWSVGDGPPFVITQGVPVIAQIILSEQHPIEVVFPGRHRNGP